MVLLSILGREVVLADKPERGLVLTGIRQGEFCSHETKWGFVPAGICCVTETAWWVVHATNPSAWRRRQDHQDQPTSLRVQF